MSFLAQRRSAQARLWMPPCRMSWLIDELRSADAVCRWPSQERLRPEATQLPLSSGIRLMHMPGQDRTHRPQIYLMPYRIGVSVANLGFDNWGAAYFTGMNEGPALYTNGLLECPGLIMKLRLNRECYILLAHVLARPHDPTLVETQVATCVEGLSDRGFIADEIIFSPRTDTCTGASMAILEAYLGNTPELITRDYLGFTRILVDGQGWIMAQSIERCGLPEICAERLHNVFKGQTLNTGGFHNALLRFGLWE